MWSPTGKQIFYLKSRNGTSYQVGAVDVQTMPAFTFGKTTTLPLGEVWRDAGKFDITPDGKYFVFAQTQDHLDPSRAAPQQIYLVVNWFEELKQRMAVK